MIETPLERKRFSGTSDADHYTRLITNSCENRSVLSDDDDDDCQRVERPNIHVKVLLVAHNGAVSLPDDQTQGQTEKKHGETDGGAVTDLKTNCESWVVCVKAEEDSDSFNA